MAFNGEGPMIKRQRTDLESGQHRNHGDQYAAYGDEPRRKRTENEKPNHVLLFTVLNPVYPITVEVLHTICSPSGQVLRIVIFKKNGVQAMVEFDSIESAKRAKEALNGADIYSGCCTLKIDFAKPTKLNVYKNDAESWDYTNPNVGIKQELPVAGRPAPLLQEPRFGAGPQPYRGDGMRGGGGGGGGGGGIPPYAPVPPDRYDDGYQNGPGSGPYPDHYPERYQPVDRYALKPDYGREPIHPAPPRPGFGPPALAQTPGGPAPAVPQQGSVMMVYGLNLEKVNAEKLFNLFCLYGNVLRIKFLKTKEGCAMIQMGDGLAVERCIHNLNNVPLLGSRLQLGFSKQAFLSDVQNPHPLPDKTPSFKDFMGNKNNRFINPAMASKNRIQPPSKILHFFNTPPNLSEDTLNKVFEENGVPPPKTVKLFPLKTDRSSSGLIEFEDIGQAVEALMMCNHVPIQNPGGKFPYIMKLCFSSSRQIPNSMRHGSDQQQSSQQQQSQQQSQQQDEMQNNGQ
ncbi:heterogeneous nuclear ribonucleoprotein L isoform X1 [Schistocerca americana]|uniref:heterogeneous nuclear ribonucleoprotein L isoform X1 n=1 Tax=Schistocerca americana TaxID=7009 RepID=UPI001F4F14AB|nr:heterogeneous nuclear ribonucleoprotein L isoform X1 [Schistocerca americana]XP_047000112.1 heterogeneous nuclear ribonucleoprotein L isoform X1 [Schistocerca americana]